MLQALVMVAETRSESSAAVRLGTSHVAMLSPLQIRAELASGLLVLLPVAVQGTQRSIGVTLRRDSLVSAAVEALLAQLRQVSAEIAAAP